MKISPMPAMGIPQVSPQGITAPIQQSAVHSLKMVTNATPLLNQIPDMVPQQVASEQASAVTEPLSPQLALIAKQRRQLQLKEREVLAKERALQTPQAGMIDVNRLKQSPLDVLLENGVTYDQLTQAIMGNQANSEIGSLKAKIEALEKGIDQKFVDKDAAAEKQVLAEMRRDADRLSRSDDFELVRETRSVPLVMKLIERTYREHGEVLDVHEAMNLMENELLKDQQRLARSKKLQGLYPQAQQAQLRQTSMRTLTNRQTASVPMSAKARAMAAFYGTLKR